MGFWTVLKGFFGAGDAVKGLSTALEGIDALTTSAEERGQLRKGLIDNWVSAQAQTIEAEYKYGGWLARSWRPILMLMWGAMVTYNIVAKDTPLDLPPELWLLLQIGIGGYIGGRSLEKVVALLIPGKKTRKLMEFLKPNG